jgi:chromosomal replication initiation ATPase DnaA
MKTRAKNYSEESFNNLLSKMPNLTVGGYLKYLKRHFYVKTYDKTPAYTMSGMKANPKSKAEIIKEIVCRNWQIQFSEIDTTSRKAQYVMPRHCLNYYLRHYTEMGTKSIGEIYSQARDHSSIIHSTQTWTDLKESKQFIKVDTLIREEIERTFK